MNFLKRHTRFSRCSGVFLILCLLAVPHPAIAQAQRSDAPASPAILRFPLVVLNDKSLLIDGLTKDDFSVWEGKQEREINYFHSGASASSVAVLIDVSASVHQGTLLAVKHAVAKFLELAHAENEYFVAEFGGGRRELASWTRDTRDVLRGLDKLAAPSQPNAKSKPKPRGQTAFYDACAAALDVLVTRPNSSRVLLLFSDGQDNQSRLTFSQLRKKVSESGVLIYSIDTTAPAYFGSGVSVGIAGQAILDELTAMSGGFLFIPEDSRDKKHAEKGITRIASELRHQYVIGFSPANLAPAGKWNKVKIKLTPRSPEHKRLTLRSREGYFSPTPKP